MQTVRTIAEQLGVVRVIDRAISFHERLPGTNPGLWGISVEYTARMQRRAGCFRGNEMAIELHPALAGPFAKRGEHIETFLHELAHAMQWIVYRRVDHGETWYEMMHQLGQQPKRCHNIAACTKPGTNSKLNLEDMDL